MLGVHSARMFGPDNGVVERRRLPALRQATPATCPGVEALTIFSSFQTVSTYLGDQRITSNLKRTDARLLARLRLHLPRGRAVRPGRRRRCALRRGDHPGDAGAPVRRRAGARQDVRGRRAVVPRRRRRRERAGHPLRAVRRRVRADHDGQDRRLQARDHGRLPRGRAGAHRATTCRSSARSSTPGCRASSCPTRPTRRWSRRSKRSTTAIARESPLADRSQPGPPGLEADGVPGDRSRCCSSRCRRSTSSTSTSAASSNAPPKSACARRSARRRAA